MSFQDIVKIESPDLYIGTAFRTANKRASVFREKRFPDRISKSKGIECEKIKAINKYLTKALRRIIESFPSLDQVSEFYLELLRSSIDYSDLKKSLGAINWAVKKIDELTNSYLQKTRRCADIKSINSSRTQYYGRISSVLKQIKKHLAFVETARLVFKDFPVIKTGMKTVCICGFPNVGKTTILSKLTGSKAEVNSYAFTTKSLNVGYFRQDGQKIQLIDTPGTLNRFDKMNTIEKQAHLAVKHCADLIIYVFDVTEPYPLDDQVKLLKNMNKFKKDIVLYLSKTDVLDKEVVDNFRKDYETLDLDGLKHILLK